MSKRSIPWKELCREYRESGLSQSEFCRKKEVSVAAFQYQYGRQRQEPIKADPMEIIPKGFCFEKIGIKESLEDFSEKIEIQLSFENGICCDLKIPEKGLSGFLQSVRSL